jgi:hypothetical protein
VSVDPNCQREGVGSALIEAGLTDLKRQGSKGCVVLGDPAYYRRFGFAVDPDLRLQEPRQSFSAALVRSAAPQRHRHISSRIWRRVESPIRCFLRCVPGRVRQRKSRYRRPHARPRSFDSRFPARSLFKAPSAGQAGAGVIRVGVRVRAEAQK